MTAALNYYRANLGMALPRDYPAVRVPVLGIWSEADTALTEVQMADSAKYLAAPFRYEKLSGRVGHWMQLRRAGDLNWLVLEFAAQALPA